MKKEFMKYCRDIDIETKKLQGRIEDCHDVFVKITKETPIDMIIEEYIDKEESRNYTDLTFWSKNYAGSFVNFIEEINVYISNLNNEIEFYRFKPLNYNFNKGTQKSRLILEYRTSNHILGIYKVTKGNCDYLMKIFRKYVYPRLTK